MDTQSIRTAFLNSPEKTQDVVIPDWLAPLLEPGTELVLKDIPGNELGKITKQASKDPNMDDVTTSAAIIVRSLANKATGELIFQPADRDAVAALGITKIAALDEQVGLFFGLTKEAIANAKKNLSQI